jgi:hypothetical protein
LDFSKWLKCQWDRAAAIVAAVLGLVALLLGWLGVSRSGLPAEQIPYLASGAVLGLFALGVAATLWLSADLRDEWRKLDQIHRDMTGGDGPSASAQRDNGFAVTGEVPVADDQGEELEGYDSTVRVGGRRQRPLRAPVDVPRSQR